MSHTFFLLDPTINPSLFQKKDLPKSEKTVSHLLMSGWFFLLGSYLLAKNWNYRPVQLKQARFIGQAVCSPGVRADQQAQSCPVPFWLPSFIFLVLSLEWSLGPMQIGHYSWDQSGKGMQIQCILKTYQGKEHVGHVVPLEVFIQVSAFYFTFFFFLEFMVYVVV